MLALALIPFLAPLATAHRGCGGHEIGRRNLGMYEPRQASPTDEASGAVSIDPVTECDYYSYAPVTAIKGNYPTPWIVTGATIQPNDNTAMSLFQTINATVNAKFPNIVPKGNPNGSFVGVQYNNSDPDCWWSWHQCDTPAADTGLQPDITTVPEPLTWGLGFDDGPNCSHNALYDYLAENQQHATMFYIGSNVMDWPLQALRAMTDGHQVCVHTWSHQYMTAFSNEQVFAELYYTRQVLKDLLGVTPKCWRPPYGDVDNRVRAFAAALNLTTIVWSDDTEDWRAGAPGSDVTAQDVTSNYQAIVNNVANGTYATHGPVVLNHELTNFTMSEFISQYPSIKNAFKNIVPLCTALNETHPYVEEDIVCPDFASYVSGTKNISASTPDTGSTTTSAASGGSTGSASGSATGSATGSSGSATAASASKSGSASGRARLLDISGGWAALMLGGVFAGAFATLI